MKEYIVVVKGMSKTQGVLISGIVICRRCRSPCGLETLSEVFWGEQLPLRFLNDATNRCRLGYWEPTLRNQILDDVELLLVINLGELMRDTAIAPVGAQYPTTESVYCPDKGTIGVETRDPGEPLFHFRGGLVREG
jgi:hypothetical protein